MQFEWYRGKEGKEFTTRGPIDIYMSESTYHTMSGKFLYGKKEDRIPLRTKRYTIRIPRPYRRLTAGSMRITPLETNHLKMKGSKDESFGYLFENTEGKIIVYLVDASRKLPLKSIDILNRCKPDLLIADCTYSNIGTSKGHSDIRGAELLLQAFQPKRMIISHIGHKNFSHEKLEETLGKVGIEVGYDGMILEV